MNLRGSAAQILARVLGDGHSLTAALDAHLPKLKDHQDRAFVQALCYGVVRHYFTLDFMLAQLLSKPLKAKDSDIKALLLLGLYQLQFMRVKPHAAVSETVAAGKHKPWAKGLLNGVLRQYQRDADSLLQACEHDPKAKYNHPDWLIEQLQHDWPDHYRQLLLANDQAPPMTLRVNLRQSSRDDYLAELTQQGIAAQASTICDTAIILDQPLGVDLLPGFAAGSVSVQDLAAQLAAQLLDLQPGQRVLDLCAAPGGKTAAILERQPDIAMLAVDVDAQRMRRVSDNLARLQLSAETLVADAAQTAWAQGRQFERILVDAPCSGLGVVRRHPDIKLLRRASDIEVLQHLQSRILDSAWSLLAPGGILLYATCSVLKPENELQIAAFLQRHADATEIPLPTDWGHPGSHGRQIITGEQQMDGFYYAKLRKNL
jgi:16S rRNA (cytosine967-C5)-methyltransferase